MEKVLTTEERIKRAQEIYERRRNENTRYSTTVVNVNEKKNYKLLKKVILQMLICFMIYYGFYHINNKQYPFSDDTMNKTKQILSYDINFNNLYNSMKEMWENTIDEKKEEEIVPPEEMLNNALEEATLSASETSEDITEEVKEEVPKSQMELDADDIKQNLELVKPLEGTISSEFGQREATSKIVSENHSGMDISAPEGTKIMASMDGVVTIAKFSSSYRKLY